jgi:hypothetical protein
LTLAFRHLRGVRHNTKGEYGDAPGGDVLVTDPILSTRSTKAQSLLGVLRVLRVESLGVLWLQLTCSSARDRERGVER